MGKLTAVFDLYAASIFMTVVFLVIAVSATGEYLGVVTNGAPDSLITLHKLAKIVEFSFAPFIGVPAGMRSAWCSLRAGKKRRNRIPGCNAGWRGCANPTNGCPVFPSAMPFTGEDLPIS